MIYKYILVQPEGKRDVSLQFDRGSSPAFVRFFNLYSSIKRIDPKHSSVSPLSKNVIGKDFSAAQIGALNKKEVLI